MHADLSNNSWDGVYYPSFGPPAEVFLGTISAVLNGYPQSAYPTAAGDFAAHELVHEITAIPDGAGTDLMGIDSVPNTPQAVASLWGNLLSPTPVGYSKLSQAQANALYRDCINAKLKAPGGAGGVGGGLGSGSLDNWWFWYLEWLNGVSGV